MSDEDIGYYRRRAEAELAQAQQATRPEAAQAHSDLARAYLDRLALAGSARQTEHA